MLKEKNFSLALPEIKSQPLKKPEQAEIHLKAVPNTAQKLQVLIFSRDPDTRFLFETFLKILDFETATAENKNDLIKTIAKRPPDLILMDVGRPFTESLSVMSELRKNERLENVPFILLSGMAQKDYRTAAFAAGAVEYLVKPVDFELLECSLRLLLAVSPDKQRRGGN